MQGGRKKWSSAWNEMMHFGWELWSQCSEDVAAHPIRKTNCHFVSKLYLETNETMTEEEVSGEMLAWQQGGGLKARDQQTNNIFQKTRRSIAGSSLLPDVSRPHWACLKRGQSVVSQFFWHVSRPHIKSGQEEQRENKTNAGQNYRLPLYTQEGESAKLGDYFQQEKEY